MTNASRLDAPEIRAVLEANRAKLAMMQKPTNAATSNNVLKDVSVRNNPVYGEEPTGTPLRQAPSFRAIPPAKASSHPPVSRPARDPGPDLSTTNGLFDLKTPPSDGYLAMPAWDSQRPFLSGAFLSATPTPSAPQAPSPPLQSYPPDFQESLLVDDLLYAFVGLEARYIRVVKQSQQEQEQRIPIQFRLQVDGRLDPALSEMTTRMLPICECVVIISRFVETRRRYDAGVVAQGLAAGMRGVLHDWELMVAQLEHQAMLGNLTLQALWYYVQSPYTALRLVAKIATECCVLRGAAILDVLHSTATSSPTVGDSAAVALAERLLRVSSQPYFAMLGRWIYEGIVDDPYEEFMVQEDCSIGRDDLSSDGSSAFWSSKFKLRERESDGAKDVPMFLSKEAQTILDIGKAVCLARSSPAAGEVEVEVEGQLDGGRTVDRDSRLIERRIPFLGLGYSWQGGSDDSQLGSTSSTSCLVAIAKAKQEAAAGATALLKTEALQRATGLKCLKKYFLAAQGDVILGLMDGGRSEMDQMSGNVSLYQLQTMLDVAIKTSSAASDSAASQVRATYDHRSVLNMLIAITQKSTASTATSGASYPARPASQHVPNHLKQKLVRESFMLSYRPPWPLSILVPDAAMAQYQMIFRHIFDLKWVERELNAASVLLATTKFLSISHRRSSFSSSSSSSSSPTAAAARSLKSAYATCQVMTHFFRQYLLYATFEVIEPLWRGLEGQLQGAETIDEMLLHHQSFLSKAMKGLLLSRKVVVLRSLLSLKQLALDFVTLIMACLDMVGHSDPSVSKVLGRAQREDFLVKALSETSFASSLRDIHAKFESRCGEFMASLAEAHEQARTEQTETREELEGLVNLTSRLDFNGYFSRRGIKQASRGWG